MEINQKDFDKKVIHPVQSYAWGDFREKNGNKVERFEVDNKSYTVLFRPLLPSDKTVGVMTQSNSINKTIIGKLALLGKKHKAIFIKIEPYYYKKINENKTLKNYRNNLKKYGLKKGKNLYPLFSNIINLTKSEPEILSEMKSKTRYNIGLAERKGVKIIIDRNDESFEEYLKLLNETTQRQDFYAHTNSYQKLMWQEMKKAGMAYVARAIHEDDTLSAWILFVFNKRLYYPYGASTRRKQNLMASHLLVWEAIRFGKKLKCGEFEMWGCLGPDPDKKHPWYGLTRFKTSFGGDLVENVGAYDLVLSSMGYRIYQLADKLRWLWLKAKRKS
jgi:lipid II:glycine glycyltransferase (peptidoglycan interpeptide bridge formation enzyme)